MNHAKARSEARRGRICCRPDAHLAEELVELGEDDLFVEHFALVPVLVVVADPRAHRTRQLPVRHVLLHLLPLHSTVEYT